MKNLKGKPIDIGEILCMDFEPEIKTESYDVQFKFRKASVNVIFQKNFLSAVVIVSLFTYINISY